MQSRQMIVKKCSSKQYNSGYFQDKCVCKLQQLFHYKIIVCIIKHAILANDNVFYTLKTELDFFSSRDLEGQSRSTKHALNYIT